MTKKRKILFAWERGAGSGHLVNHLTLIREMAARGWEVLFAVQNTQTAARVLGPTGCTFVQAPPPGRRLPLKQRMWPLDALPQMFFNIGFHDPGETSSRLRAWRALYEEFQPDLIIADFAPTALLAARAMGVRALSVGPGYLYPPRDNPMAPLRYWEKTDPEALRRDETRLLDHLQRALLLADLPSVDGVGALCFGDEDWIRSIPELDPFHPRAEEVIYRPVLAALAGGVSPEWPPGEGKKIFCYQNPTRTAPALLGALKASGRPTLVFAPNPPPEWMDSFACPTLRFSPQPLKMEEVAAQCDLAVGDGTHGMVLQMLNVGKPMLLGRTHIENTLNARKVMEAGAGLAWPPLTSENPKDPGEALTQLLEEPRWSEAAAAVGARLRGRKPFASPEQGADAIDGLIATSDRRFRLSPPLS